MIESSYNHHLKLESLGTFLRREWKAIAICGGGFSVIMAALVFLVDPAFFYPRIQTDPLNYILKAKSLVENGTTAARWAVNLRPFPYAAMPGVLRAPALALFTEFDDQLRMIQLLNIPIVAAVAILSAYIFSWTQPRQRHSLVIAGSFAFTLLSPTWIANVFLPLADAPFAVFSLGAVLLAMKVVCSPKSLRSQPFALASCAILFVLAFLTRFTAPAILVFAAILARGRWHRHLLSKRVATAAVLGAILFVAVLIGLNADALFGRYFYEPLYFLIRGDKPGMILNLLGVALPGQIIPNFASGFIHPPYIAYFTTTFASSPSDAVWLAVGVLISIAIVAGLWISRRNYLPEIVYFLVPLPVLALVLPSTTRYVMTYQPFIWIFFWIGLVSLSDRIGISRALARNRMMALAGAGLLVTGVVGLRLWKTAGTASEKALVVGITTAPRYVSEVSDTFRQLRQYLETLPRERTLLVGDAGTLGRWTVISDRDYYHQDSSLAAVVRERDVYLLVECGTREVCNGWDFYTDKLKKRANKYGRFEFDSVFAAASHRARVQVYRMRDASAQSSSISTSH